MKVRALVEILTEDINSSIDDTPLYIKPNSEWIVDFVSDGSIWIDSVKSIEKRDLTDDVSDFQSACISIEIFNTFFEIIEK